MICESELIDKIKNQLEEILHNSNILTVNSVEKAYSKPGSSNSQVKKIDLKFKVKTKAGKEFSILIETKSPGHPRFVRMTASELKEYTKVNKKFYGAVGAPFLPNESK